MIRNLVSEDRPQVERWVLAEPTHVNNTFDWYSETGTKSVVVEDEAGAVLVAKFTPCLRMDTDFSPEATPKRIAKAIISGLAEMEQQAKEQGFKEIVFESSSSKLVAFCERLGYRQSPDSRKVL